MFFRVREFMKPSAESGGQMIKFYRVALGVSFALFGLTVLILYQGIAKSRLHIPLLPKADSPISWFSDYEFVVPDGQTRLTLNSAEDSIDYSFLLSSDARYPYAGYTFNFAAINEPEATVDLSKFQSVTFNIRCDPNNTLMFIIFTLDEAVTNLVDSATRRVSWSFFSCDEESRFTTIQLNETYTPDWWLNQQNHDFSDRGHDLGQVYGVAIANSVQSPRNTDSSVSLTELSFHGQDKRYFHAAIAISVGLWLCFFFWLVRTYVNTLVDSIKRRVKQDRPLIAYQELSIAPNIDETTSRVLRFMATEYANPEVSFDLATSLLSLSRIKINTILKEEVGLTFNAYLNRLRLTETARILSENPDVGITEIAYSVGYNNVTYFNKLFKDEYGCSPRTFKAVCRGGGLSERSTEEWVRINRDGA